VDINDPWQQFCKHIENPQFIPHAQKISANQSWLFFSQAPKPTGGAGLFGLSKEFSTEIVDR